MTITKCDLCKKEIKKDQAKPSIVLSGGDFGYISHTICMTCASPVMPFVKKHNLDEDERTGSRTPRRAA